MAGERILIVEDHPLNTRLFAAVLGSRGYDVRCVPDAEQALLAVTDFRPHLVLMDISLPGMSGLELTKRLRLDERTRDIVIVAVTAHAMTGDDERTRRAGCDGYVTKPIDVRNFPAVVARYLANRQTRSPQSELDPRAS